MLGITFPLSNYTLSYNLIKRIGFWDTCPDAIGEDFHTTLKALWKTDGEVKTEPVFAACSQYNIYTGKGYVADVCARFWQGERHCQGAGSFSYSIKQFLNSKITLKKILVLISIFDIVLVPAVFPWVSISYFLQQNVLCHFFVL